MVQNPQPRPTRLLRLVVQLSLALSVMSGVAACGPIRTPVPDGVIPPATPVTIEEEQYGHQVLTAITQQHPIDYNNNRGPEVERVVDRLTRAAGAQAEPWHVYVLKADDVKNAAATRGNHVFVWSGMLIVASTEADLATVLAHEISHVLARHTEPSQGETIREALIGIGAMAAGIAVSAATRGAQFGGDFGNVASSAAQELGRGFFVYPYSRDLEFEADRIGMLLMGQAGYDPKIALDFWTKVQNDPDFQTSAGFFSTHPPAQDRLQKLRDALPDAELRYRGGAGGSSGGATGGAKSGSNSASSSSSATWVPPAPPAGQKAPISNGAAQMIPSGLPTSVNDVWNSPTRYIKHDGVKLREKPTEQSKAVGEFKRGASVNIVREHGRFAEIDQPDRGFIPLSEIEGNRSDSPHSSLK